MPRKQILSLIKAYSFARKGITHRSVIHFEEKIRNAKLLKTINLLNSQGNDKIYANNYLNMNNINVIGFDLDYTLVTYSPELQDLIFELAKMILITKFGFPTILSKARFDPSFAVRGLSVDLTHGTLCKLSHLQRVGIDHVFLGKRRMSTGSIYNNLPYNC